jgi:hypothetical protein
MVLYVPTRGRVSFQYTLQSIPPDWHDNVVIVCPPSESKKLIRMFPKMGVIGCKIKNETIAKKRAWIFENAEKFRVQKIMVLDDDLTLQHLVGGKLIRNDKAISKMFDKIEKKLDTYMHGTIAPRYMHHTLKGEWSYTVKCAQISAFRVDTVKAACALGRIELFTDLDYTLQLLTAGFDNFKYHHGAYNEMRGFNAPGGVSSYRTGEMIDRALDDLIRFFPEIVKKVRRVDKDGDTEYKGRFRPVIQWKKALKFGIAKDQHELG